MSVRVTFDSPLDAIIETARSMRSEQQPVIAVAMHPTLHAQLLDQLSRVGMSARDLRYVRIIVNDALRPDEIMKLRAGANEP